MAQFVPLELDTEQDEWQQWARKFPHEGNAIPIVYIIRADGQVMHAKSGTPEELAAFLLAHRKAAGAAISPKQAEQLAKDVETAAKAFEAGDLAAAVKLLGKSGGSESFAKAAVAATELAKQIRQRGQAMLEQADRQLTAGGDDALPGALTLLEVERLFKADAELSKQVREMTLKHRKQYRDLLAQADLLDTAIEFESKKEMEKALRGFLLVAEKHAGTPAGEFAKQRAQKLQESGVKAASASAGSSPNTSAAPAASGDAAALKKAESRLRLGKSLMKSRPETAVQYFKEVLMLAPGTEMAKEAESLLKALR